MKTTTIETRPQSSTVSALGSMPSPESLPSFPAFPVRNEGVWVHVAVPALVIVPSDTVGQSDPEQYIREAVDFLRQGEVELYGVPVECIPLAPGVESPAGAPPESRAELLRVLSATVAAWRDGVQSASASAPDAAAGAAMAANEVMALLALYQGYGVAASPPSLT